VVVDGEEQWSGRGDLEAAEVNRFLFSFLFSAVKSVKL